MGSANEKNLFRSKTNFFPHSTLTSVRLCITELPPRPLHELLALRRIAAAVVPPQVVQPGESLPAPLALVRFYFRVL